MHEQLRLLKGQEYYETEILPKLKHKSDEFFLLAMATQTNYDSPNRFEDTCKYFEGSIKSHANKFNIFNYAKFLQEHNQFKEAEEYYSQYLEDFSLQLSQAEYAMTLNNLAVLHSDQNNYQDALLEYEEALEIRRKLAEANPNAYLPDVATTLNNLAILHRNQNNYQDALQEYEEALGICRKLAETNPNTYLPDVATTLNNLANLHSDQNKYEEALLEYEEALGIYRKLAEANPNAYLPDVATTLINLSIYFQDAVAQRGKSLEYVKEAMEIILPIVDRVPFTKRYMQNAIRVLENWDLSDEEIEQMIEDKKKETDAKELNSSSQELFLKSKL